MVAQFSIGILAHFSISIYKYLRIVITIWREYGMLCPIIIPKDQDAEGAVMVKIGPTTDMKVAEMVDKIWDIAGAKRLVKEIEK